MLLTAGCVSDSKKNIIGSTPTIIQSSQITPTIDENQWALVVDNTYVLTATGLAATSRAKQRDIPVTPNTAYRLKVNSEYPLFLSLFEHQDPFQYNSQGYVVSGGDSYDVVRFATMVSGYNGFIKTDNQQKFLRVEWAVFAHQKELFGKSQNVQVKLERYNGNASIFPVTTTDPAF